MKQLELIPCIYVTTLSDEAETELIELDYSTHDNNPIVHIDWQYPDSFPALKAWLIETYGEIIMKYSTVAFMGT